MFQELYKPALIFSYQIKKIDQINEHDKNRPFNIRYVLFKALIILKYLYLIKT